MQGNQRLPVGRTEKTLAGNNQAVRPSDRDVESPRDLQVDRTERDDLGWLLDVGVDVLGRGIIDSPARSTRERDRRDHPHLIDGDHRAGAVHTRRIANIKHEEMAPGWIVG